MAIINVTGPTFLMVSRAASASGSSSGYVAPATALAKTDLLFLGTCESGASIQIQTMYEEVINDVGGSMLPIAKIYQGQQGAVVGTLNKYNEAVYARLADHPFQAGTRGIDLPGDIGTVLEQEGGTFHLVVWFPYNTKPIYTSNFMPTCFHFWNVKFGNEDFTTGTRAGKRQAIFICDRWYDDTTGALSLYDHVMPAGITYASFSNPSGVLG